MKTITTINIDLLMNEYYQEQPDILVINVNDSNLKRNLLFASQIIYLKIPTVITLTMMDLARKKGVEIDVAGLERELGVPIVPINPRDRKSTRLNSSHLVSSYAVFCSRKR